MTQDIEHKLFESFCEEEERILFAKAADYANADVLSNFKKVAAIMDITPEQYCTQMMATKIVRLANLITSNKLPKNESITDSIHDLRNYTFLLGCLIKEKEEQQKPLETLKSRNVFLYKQT